MNITSINLNGIELADGINYWFHLSGFFDFEKNIITNDLMMDGENFGRSKNKSKTLVLDGWVLSNDEILVFALNKTLAGNGLKPLIINDTYLCYVEISSRGSTSDNSHEISCQLTMPDPYLYALTPQTAVLGAQYSTGVIFDTGTGITFGPGVVFGAATGAGGTLTNGGNADAYPVITIVGACSGIAVTNQTTGESISINANLADSDTLIIDCSAGPNSTRGVYLNGVQALGLKTSPGWIHCPPGDNVFLFSRNSLEDKKHCTISLQSRWI